MNFAIFNLMLLVAGFLAVFVFSLGVMACLAPLALFPRAQNLPKAAGYPFVTLAGAFQVYFWGFWAAYCVALTMSFTKKPDVTWNWLYWVTAFGWSISLVGWFAHKERQSSTSAEDARGTERGAVIYSLIALVAFVVFAFAPSLMRVPYGWALRFLGLASG